MPEMLARRVEKATVLDDRYLAHAAHQSMSFFLDDWEEAYSLLGRRIEVLRGYRNARQDDSERGLWPAVQDRPGAAL